jgi:pimeloyl-ACP methyl ester carboxylesterase
MRDISFSGVDGVDLVGWETGSGPTIVLLHAGRERAAVWVPVAEVLCGRHDLHCVATDQRGHGASGGDAERISDYGADLRQVLASQDGPCVVVGASLGGFAAIDALRFPEARALWQASS